LSSIWLIYSIWQRSSFIILFPFPFLFPLFRLYRRRRLTRTTIRRATTRRRIRSLLVFLLNLLTALSSSSELLDVYLLERSLSDELDEDDELYDLRLLLHKLEGTFVVFSGIKDSRFAYVNIKGTNDRVFGNNDIRRWVEGLLLFLAFLRLQLSVYGLESLSRPFI
jgi:hypothetical protein